VVIKKSGINFVSKYKKNWQEKKEKYKILSKLDHLDQHTSLSFYLSLDEENKNSFKRLKK
jgi:hypothetical protein